MPQGLSGVRVVCLESRRSFEMSKLVEKQGGVPIAAPSMKEVPLSEQAEALAFADVLMSGQCDLLLLLTGVGARLLFDALKSRLDDETVRRALSTVAVYCRGPKPLAVCREWGIVPKGVAPEPNTSDDLRLLVERQESLAGKRIYVQEYGRPSVELRAALEAGGAHVETIGVYSWTLPDDTAPLEAAIRALCSGEADAIVVTSAQQLEHLMLVAGRLGLNGRLLERLRNDVVVASIGPVTSEALQALGVAATTTPPHPKMGHLVSHLASEWPRLAQRRAGGGVT